jgi:hypothetical protein
MNGELRHILLPTLPAQRRFRANHNHGFGLGVLTYSSVMRCTILRIMVMMRGNTPHYGNDAWQQSQLRAAGRQARAPISKPGARLIDKLDVNRSVRNSLCRNDGARNCELRHTPVLGGQNTT